MESIAADPGRQSVALDDPPQHEETALERGTVKADRGDKELAQHRQRHASRPPEGIGDHRHVAPAEQAQAFRAACLPA